MKNIKSAIKNEFSQFFVYACLYIVVDEINSKVYWHTSKHTELDIDRKMWGILE